MPCEGTCRVRSCYIRSVESPYKTLYFAPLLRAHVLVCRGTGSPCTKYPHVTSRFFFTTQPRFCPGKHFAARFYRCQFILGLPHKFNYKTVVRTRYWLAIADRSVRFLGHRWRSDSAPPTSLAPRPVQAKQPRSA